MPSSVNCKSPELEAMILLNEHKKSFDVSKRFDSSFDVIMNYHRGKGATFEDAANAFDFLCFLSSKLRKEAIVRASEKREAGSVELINKSNSIDKIVTCLSYLVV